MDEWLGKNVFVRLDGRVQYAMNIMVVQLVMRSTIVC